jgi:hypothetical protein
MDGRRFEADVKFDSGSAMACAPRDGAAFRIELEKVFAATFGSDSVSGAARRPALARGIVTIDGTVCAAEAFLQLDRQTIRIAKPAADGGGEVALKLDHIARILFAPLSTDELARAPAGKGGVILDGGDFAEGDLVNVDGGKVRISSILFGIQTFDCGSRALAVVLRDTSAAPPERLSRYNVTMADGSRFSTDAITFDHGHVTLTDPTFGAITAVPKDVAEIRAGGERLVSLTTLKPRDGAPPADVIAPPDLLDYSPARFVQTRGGSAIHFDLDGKYESLLVTAGMPLALEPSRAVRFIVNVDGKEQFHGDPRTSVDDPLPIAVPLRGAHDLELRVEIDGAMPATSTATLGAIGLWGDPTLVRLP